jgi:hypothetical protein
MHQFSICDPKSLQGHLHSNMLLLVLLVGTHGKNNVVKWPAYVRFKTLGDLVNVNLRTLLFVAFTMSCLAWNQFEIWIEIQLSLSISSFLVSDN